MRFVIDCSVAVKWVVDEAGSEAAAQLLPHELFAPDFVYLECANALWKLNQRKEAHAEQGAFKLLAIRQVNLQTFPLADLVARALDIGCLLQHPVNDCLYIAAAETCLARVVTADDRLLRQVAKSPLAHLVMPLSEATTN